jgi:hypothetical protein
MTRRGAVAELAQIVSITRSDNDVQPLTNTVTGPASRPTVASLHMKQLIA